VWSLTSNCPYVFIDWSFIKHGNSSALTSFRQLLLHEHCFPLAQSCLIYSYQLLYYFRGRDSSVGTATWYGLNGPGSNPGGARFSAPIQTDPGAHPPSYTMGTGSFPRVKRPGRGVHHPLHPAPKLKKG